jgi:nuclear cap-binding protein subunit 1
LSTGAAHGEGLAQPHFFELVSNTVGKVTGHARQVLLTQDTDNETKEKEVTAVRELFRALNDALQSWAGGSKDELIEDGDGSTEEEAMIRRWGQRWLRVFRRMGAIEEAFALEQKKDKMDTDGAEDIQ